MYCRKSNDNIAHPIRQFRRTWGKVYYTLFFLRFHFWLQLSSCCCLRGWLQFQISLSDEVLNVFKNDSKYTNSYITILPLQISHYTSTMHYTIVTMSQCSHGSGRNNMHMFASSTATHDTWDFWGQRVSPCVYNLLAKFWLDIGLWWCNCAQVDWFTGESHVVSECLQDGNIPG